MTKETKIWIKDWLTLLFLPITGIHYLITECSTDDYNDFLSAWLCYLLLLTIWCGIVAFIGFSIWGLIYHFDIAILPVSIIYGGLFVIFILPIIIHKLIHKK